MSCKSELTTTEIKAGCPCRPCPYLIAANKSNDASSLTLDLVPAHGNGTAGDSTKRKIQRQTSSVLSQEVKLIIIWLERMEDHASLPVDDLLSETLTGLEGSPNGPSLSPKDAFFVYIQPMKSGLMRIKMQGQTTKYV